MNSGCLIQCLATLAAFFIALSSNAQESKSYDGIEEIVVTATKREQTIYDVPIAVSVLQNDSIEDRGIDDLVDIGKFVPNLTITNFGAGHTSSANALIRGIGTQDHLITTDPGVGIYVDGVYLGRQVGQHWFLNDIERVEILRGPQGTLYGRNSIGGAINIVTATPGDDPSSKLSTRFGLPGRVDFYTHFDRRVGDSSAFSFTGSVKRRGGSGQFLNLPNAKVEVGELNEVAGRLKFYWQPGANYSFTLSVDANDGTSGLNPYTTLIDEVPFGAVYSAGYRNSDISEDPYDNNTVQINQLETTNSARGVSLIAERSPTDQVVTKLIGSSRRSDYQAGLDDDSFVDDFLSFPEKGNADQKSVELQVIGSTSTLEYVFGLYHFEESGSNSQDPTIFLGFAGSFLLEQEVFSSAIYANVKRQVFDNWEVGVGFRHTDDQKDGKTDVGIGLVESTRSWQESSLDLSAHYSISSRLKAYGAIQSGYRSGEFPARPYCLFGDPQCFSAGDNITALNREVGLKGRLGNNAKLNIAAFSTQYRDLPYQVNTTEGEGFNTVNLIADQITTGLEIESRVQLSESVSVDFAYGLIGVDFEGQGDDHLVAPLTPSTTLSVSPEYQRTLTSGKLLTLRGDYSFRGEMWGEPSSDPGRYTQIDSRQLANLMVELTSEDEDWVVALYGENIFDERYDQARLNTGDYILRILSNDVREIGVRVEYNF